MLTIGRTETKLLSYHIPRYFPGCIDTCTCIYFLNCCKLSTSLSLLRIAVICRMPAQYTLFHLCSTYFQQSMSCNNHFTICSKWSGIIQPAILIFNLAVQLRTSQLCESSVCNKSNQGHCYLCMEGTHFEIQTRIHCVELHSDDRNPYYRSTRIPNSVSIHIPREHNVTCNPAQTGLVQQSCTRMKTYHPVANQSTDSRIECIQSAHHYHNTEQLVLLQSVKHGHLTVITVGDIEPSFLADETYNYSTS